MLTISFVNFLQVSLLTLSLFGLAVFAHNPQFRRYSVLLLLVALSSLFNLLEELNITRGWYLVTPVFVLGFGPAIYLAVQENAGGRLHSTDWLHFVPMFLALPFTYDPQMVIAAGTLSRLTYAFLSLRHLRAFHLALLRQRSDAEELSLGWLVWLVVIFTFISLLNHVRLNIQPLLGHELNVMGQGISTVAAVLFTGIVLQQLIVNRELFSLRSESDLVSDAKQLDINYRKQSSTNSLNEQESESKRDESPLDSINDEENLAFYQTVFEQLQQQILDNEWHFMPRLTLLKLSELSGISTRDISRAVNLSQQHNFNDYINGLRIDSVCQQLQQGSERKLLDLAMDAGFTSKSTFNHAFKSLTGMTPSAYKRAHT
ncbi:AraC family transcriptional regulator [Paraneptunicella aestuarii]|uniref:AraC family transcriptional regulator n=1 Tax=Paraneptunicella aestuarii TaxID=2831148 RepID=UPI001E56387D|nr:helix-turn-helix domain-containing protein [Paraneptunicella aestuarii]UAA37833.1 AraC family transcriptional regulator [Paraneptunicella aestuarii]